MNKKLTRAKINKKDEFYTQLSDIKKELKHYKKHFNGKIIYCNTDNYKYSNFVKYFVDNFKDLKLKKIISLDLEGNYFEYDGVTKQYSKFEDGDFRGKYSIDILRGVDIVVTNPPFSLFREHVAQLIKYDKKFLIMGNNNVITYKKIFPLIKENKIWLGYHANKTMEFRLPDHYDKWSRIDEYGNKYGKVPAISWFTNLDFDRRYEELFLYHEYYGNEDKYPQYENYKAINVDRVKDIPMDYSGVMGVPITFLSKYNPKQFKLLGMAAGSSRANKLYGSVPYKPHKKDKGGNGVVNGKVKYARLFIRAKTSV